MEFDNMYICEECGEIIDRQSGEMFLGKFLCLSCFEVAVHMFNTIDPNE